jgi:hypothetical protein
MLLEAQKWATGAVGPKVTSNTRVLRTKTYGKKWEMLQLYKALVRKTLLGEKNRPPRSRCRCENINKMEVKIRFSRRFAFRLRRCGLFDRARLTADTRWFKYDRDWLCVNKSQFVPVIFEPPCINVSGMALLPSSGLKWNSMQCCQIVFNVFTKGDNVDPKEGGMEEPNLD